MKITEFIYIDNLKCGGCANTIQNAVNKIEGVEITDIDFDTSGIAVEWDDTKIEREQIIAALSRLGYPEAGTSTNLQKAKSYVSCMIGRVTG